MLLHRVGKGQPSLIQLHRGKGSSSVPGGERGLGWLNWGGGYGQALQVFMWEEGPGSALTHCSGLGILATRKGGGTNCHCSPTTKFPDAWGAQQAKVQGSAGHIWSSGCRLNFSGLGNGGAPIH